MRIKTLGTVLGSCKHELTEDWVISESPNFGIQATLLCCLHLLLIQSYRCRLWDSFKSLRRAFSFGLF